MRRGWRIIVIIVLVGLLGTQMGALAIYFDDQKYLGSVMEKIASPMLPPSTQVEKIVAFLRDRPGTFNESYFFLPFFAFMGPTARQVAENGGDCAQRSRLAISLLRVREIKASKWALYSSDLRPRHAAVEARVETGRMVVDPLFGLWFPRPEGGYYGMKELKEDARILEERIRYIRLRKEQPGTARLELYPVDEYIYQYARSINWDKSVGMQMLYRILEWMMGKKVNSIPRPVIAEEPSLIVVVGIAILEGKILLTWGFVVRVRRKRGLHRREGVLKCGEERCSY